MRALSLAELQAPLDAQLLGVDQSFSRVTTDSRSVSDGDFFVALKGERFDGHDYLVEVQRAGAVAALVSEPASGDFTQLQVSDTQIGLGLLGAYNRSLYNGPLVAITGSNGKTTVKNMVSAVLAKSGNTLSTEGNYNNEIGVPLTLLRLNADTQYAVVEMGAAKAGDIAWLCQLGRPTISLLLNAMPAHLQGFGSVEDVAQAKGEIYDGLGATDCAIINADQPWAGQWRRRAGTARILDFGVQNAAAISASAIRLRGVEGVSFTASTPDGEIAIRLALPGEHNVANALAAIAVGQACGLGLTDIRDALETLEPVGGRLRLVHGGSGATLIDDCYNANPGSVRAAINVLSACEGRRTLILGVMGELGNRSETLHREIGEYARESGIEQFWGVGEELHVAVDAFGPGGRAFPDRQALIGIAPDAFTSADTVLVKGSRSARMETIFEALQGTDGGEAASC